MKPVLNFHPAHVIARKRDGAELSTAEIAAFVRGFVEGAIPDYQMAALAMATYLQGMTAAETAALTVEMVASGGTLDVGERDARVDKHSTGGIGDKSSLVVAPLLACCGLRVPMISGRGLGPTGGTLDKLESIPGFRVNLDAKEIHEIVDRVGCVITGATVGLVPADRKLYALRDVTATVASIPLITASVMSKKLAENLSALVLDVKFGSGAFMKTIDEARKLAGSMVDVGALMGLKTTAILTSMDQPNGRWAGNSVEIDEALDTLAGRGPADLLELTLALAGEVLAMKGISATAAEARATLVEHLHSGRALRKFRDMVAAQGGDLDAPRPRAPSWTLEAPTDGYVTSIDTERLGIVIVEMGGGRKRVGDPIDHSVGIEMLAKIGDRVVRGGPLMNILAPTVARSRAMPLIEEVFSIGSERPQSREFIVERVTAETRFAERPDSLGESQRELSNGAASGSDELVEPEFIEQLVQAATEAREHAYAPYSGFHVGAAVWTGSGHAYRGANVENASFGLTLCAERVAIAAARAAGEMKIVAMVVVSSGAAPPCGACRQFAAEFNPDLPIYLVDPERSAQPMRVTLAELLPRSFTIPEQALKQRPGNAGRHKASQRAAKHRS